MRELLRYLGFDQVQVCCLVGVKLWALGILGQLFGKINSHNATTSLPVCRGSVWGLEDPCVVC